ncbi:MAG: type 1 glutamine amidotransferase [Brooklawnia sp.]|jgi:GMP synthase (glutamine-hydrolysing)
MAKQPRITVLQPAPDVPLGRFDDWLADAGVRFSVIELWQKDVPQLAATGDGLLLLGGPMSVQSTNQNPWIDPLLDLLADAHSIDIPILGICLGHQLLAAALGGRVRVEDAAGGEHGLVRLDWTPQAADDPIFAPIAALGQVPVAMYHNDVVADLPAGAVELAYSPTYRNQVFRLDSAWGVQFHPEKSPQMLRRRPADTEQGYRAMVAELTAADTEISRAAQLVAVGFAKYVRAQS